VNYSFKISLSLAPSSVGLGYSILCTWNMSTCVASAVHRLVKWTGRGASLQTFILVHFDALILVKPFHLVSSESSLWDLV